MHHSLTEALQAGPLVVRPLKEGDLARVGSLAGHGPPVPWNDRGFRAKVRCGEAFGYVAEGGRQLVGYVLGALDLPDPPAEGGFWKSLARLLGTLIPRHPRKVIRLDLFPVEVAPGWPPGEVEPALLGRFDRDLRQRARRVQLAVPETDLATQLFLRRAGYRATCLLPGYFGSEDGYLIVWPPPEHAAPSKCI